LGYAEACEAEDVEQSTCAVVSARRKRRRRRKTHFSRFEDEVDAAHSGRNESRKGSREMVSCITERKARMG
jgi:hypothetical protein